MKSLSVTILLKPVKRLKQFFPVVLFIILHRKVLTFDSVGKILSVTM